MLAEIEKLPEALGQLRALVGDSGYFSADHEGARCGRQIEPLIALCVLG